MTQQREIPLNKLVLSPHNMRQGDVDVSDLEANFRATKKILQNLRVTAQVDEKTGKATGKFEVHVGGRRLRMLNIVAADKVIPKTWPVPCAICADPAEALEESITENQQRRDVHPAQRFKAFKALADQGKSTAEIADMFGESEIIIKRRLKLAVVSPRLFELFERNEINFEQMQAFTVTDDHAKQEAAYFDAPTKYAHDIKRRLTEGSHSTDHWMMRFVGLENFKAAGGEVKQDLFANEEGDGHFSDMALLEKLAFEKMEKAADAERAAGWKWVETALQFNYGAAEKFGRVYPNPLPLSDEQIAALEALEAKAVEVNNELEAAEEDEELYDEFVRLEEEIKSLKSAAGEAYAPEDMAIAGVMIAISGSSIKIERGCVKPGADLKTLKDRQREAENAGEVTAEGVIPQKGGGKRADGLSQAMVANLTAHRTMALRAALMDRPDVALIAVTHRLVTLAFYRQASAYGEGQIPETALVLAGADYQTNPRQHAEDLTGTPADLAIQAKKDALKAELPTDNLALWDYLAGLSAEKLADLMAFAVAQTVYAVEPAGYGVQATRKQNSHQIARAVGLDMADYWTADAAFFGALGKPELIKALQEGAEADPAALEKLKKAELAGRAATELEGKRWLPDVLRTPPAVAEKVIAAAQDESDADEQALAA